MQNTELQLLISAVLKIQLPHRTASTNRKPPEFREDRYGLLTEPGEVSECQIQHCRYVRAHHTPCVGHHGAEGAATELIITIIAGLNDELL